MSAATTAPDGASGEHEPTGRLGISLTGRAHDRVAHLRTDAEWLAGAWADPAAQVLEVRADRLPAYEDPDGSTRLQWRSAPEVDLDAAVGRGAVAVLLGQRDGTTYLALLHPGPPEDDPSPTADQPPARWTTLRDTVQLIHPGDAPLAVHTVGLAEWHRSTRFCARCGGGLAPTQAGHQLECERCRRHHFPRMDPAVIMLVATGEGESERCLLGRHPSWPAGRYSTLAGFVEPGESMEDAVRREVAEETGVRVGAVRWEGDQPWPFPASLMIGFTARAESTDVTVDGVEIEDARWFTRAELTAAAQTGEIALPSGASISRTLIERWSGHPLPGQW